MNGIGATCPKCGLVLHQTSRLEAHLDYDRCQARQLAAVLRLRGLVPVELALNSVSTHIDEALAMFELPHELHRTRAQIRGKLSRGDQAWTDEAGIAMMEVVQHVSKLLNLSFPEAARRIYEHQELIGPFDTARRLGGSVAALREILLVIDYVVGSNGKRRPHAPNFVRPRAP